MALDYTIARELLDRLLNESENPSSGESSMELPTAVDESITGLFLSKTQSYREVALGCAIVRYFDKDIDLSLPYINLGDRSYNGRTLDERVINPFLYCYVPGNT